MLKSLHDIDADSLEDNKTNRLTPLVGDSNNRDLGDSFKPKEQITLSKHSYQKKKAYEMSRTPSKTYDNSLTVIKHLKDKEVSVVNKTTCILHT